jgi:phosphoribosylformylglycinamidine cyclo-ligase
VARALHALIESARYQPPRSHGRAVPIPGHYAGLLRVGEGILALTTDTVGTKILLAEELGSFEPIGEDIVAVNVNDLAAVGARPAAMVDVISCARPDPGVFAALGRGIRRGLQRSECTLVGGESAVVPDLVSGWDVGGTALGFFPPGRRPVTGKAIRPGDRILGLPASGFHANGFTLVRALLRERRVDLGRPRPGGRRSLGSELLQPTRIYTPASEALAEEPGVTGFAHISGGGVRNLVRLHGEVDFVLDRWPSPRGLFAWIQGLGNLSEEEMYQTFNVGIGFVAVVRPSAVARCRARLARAGFPHVVEVGHIGRGRGVHVPQAGLEYLNYA